MQVLRSKRAGFCMGVALALKKLDALVDKGGHVATFGPIIHNPFVLAEYAMKGVRCFKNVQEVNDALEPFYSLSNIISPQNPGNISEKDTLLQKTPYEHLIPLKDALPTHHSKNTQTAHNASAFTQNTQVFNLLIRAHGIPRETESFLNNLPHICLSDATCPKVKDAQKSIEKTTTADTAIQGAKAKTLLLYGDANHPEVDGLVSYAQGKYRISTDRDFLIQYVQEHAQEQIVLAAQTTQDRPTFDILKEKLLQISSNILVLNTICDATRERQEEALELTKKVDIMVVVGGKESGNTKRLAEIIFSQNIPTVFVETAEELQRESFIGMNVVGITAGASTPKYLVDKTEELLLSW